MTFDINPECKLNVGINKFNKIRFLNKKISKKVNF